MLDKIKILMVGLGVTAGAITSHFIGRGLEPGLQVGVLLIYLSLCFKK